MAPLPSLTISRTSSRIASSSNIGIRLRSIASSSTTSSPRPASLRPITSVLSRQSGPRSLRYITRTASTASQSVPNPTTTNATSIPAASDPTSARSSASSPPNPNASGSSTSNDANADADAPPPNASAYTRFKLLAKKYGWYAFGMYWTLSIVDFTLTYIVVHSVGSERIEPLIGGSLHTYRTWRHGEEGTRQLEEEDHRRREEAKAELANGNGDGKKKSGYIGSRMFWAEVALAYTIHKIALLPVRAALTVAWTPKVVRWLQARGWAGKVGWGSSYSLLSFP